MNLFKNILKYASYCIKENIGIESIVMHNAHLIVGTDSELNNLSISRFNLPLVIYSKNTMFNCETGEYKEYHVDIHSLNYINYMLWIRYYIGDRKYYRHNKYNSCISI